MNVSPSSGRKLKMQATLRKCLIAVLCLMGVSHAVEPKPKRVFLRTTGCDGILGSSIISSFRDAIRASAGYQLANSLDDSGGYEVVITVFSVCTETTNPVNSEHIASAATIFGTGTCTFGNCSVTSNEGTLQSNLCSGNKGAECGRLIYSSLDDYMGRTGGTIFDSLSSARVKALGTQR